MGNRLLPARLSRGSYISFGSDILRITSYIVFECVQLNLVVKPTLETRFFNIVAFGTFSEKRIQIIFDLKQIAIAKEDKPTGGGHDGRRLDSQRRSVKNVSKLKFVPERLKTPSQDIIEGKLFKKFLRTKDDLKIFRRSQKPQKSWQCQSPIGPNWPFNFSVVCLISDDLQHYPTVKKKPK